MSSTPRVFTRRTRIAAGVIALVRRHAAEASPQECCGLLIGTPDRIVHAHRARNVHASTTRYLIDPADHFAAIRQAREAGLDVIGAYHSHPASPPVPSATDLDEALPSFFYLIVGPRSGDVGLFSLHADRFERVSYQVDTDA